MLAGNRCGRPGGAGALPLCIAALVIAGRRETVRALARFVPDCIVLFRRLLADPRLPRRTKLLLGALVAYLPSTPSAPLMAVA
jgi:hypothetical protein